MIYWFCILILLFIVINFIGALLHGKKEILKANEHTFKHITLENKQSELAYDHFHKGMNILLYGKQNLSNAEYVFTKLKELGVNRVSFNFPFVQEHWQSNEIKMNPSITPPISDLEAMIDLAHSFGFQVMLRPIIDERELIKTGHWRGDIQPKNPRLWFKNYRTILLPYIHLAQKKQVELFNIGTELNSLETYNHEWESLIDEIRAIFKGDLIYSFNWNIVQNIPNATFISKLDYVGIDAYFPLEVPDHANVKDLENAWSHWVKVVENLKIKKKIIITEVGIVPIEGAYRTPYDWIYDHQLYSPETQVNYYIATFNQWKPIIHGIYWWVIQLEEDSMDINYSPLGLPTEEIIKKQFQET